MTPHRTRRLRKIGAGLLAAAVTASGLVLDATVAEAAAPTIVNTGLSGGTPAIPNWLETPTVGRNNRSSVGLNSAEVAGTLIVKHDVGLSVTGIAIDQDFDGNDNTSSAAPTSAGVQVFDLPGTSSFSTVRFAFLPPPFPNQRTGPTLSVCGGSNSRPTAAIRVQAVLSDGSRTPSVSATVQQLMETGCTLVDTFPNAFNGQQSATEVTPGTSVGFSFTADDPDSSGLFQPSNNSFRRYRWRIRRLNDGAIVGPLTCGNVGNAGDNSTQSFTFTFPQRGRDVAEVELGSNEAANNSCGGTPPGGNFANGNNFWRVGTVDVQSGPTSGTTLTLSGAPAKIAAGDAYDVTATAADSGATGRVQAIEWDADGDSTDVAVSAPGGFERRIFADESAGGSVTAVPENLQQHVTTTVGDCADRTVTARITDNGVMNGSDPGRVQVSQETTTAVNCQPSAPDATVSTNEDTPQGFTLAPVDGDGDPLAYSPVSGPSHGTVSGTFPTFTYNPAPDFNGTDSYTYQVDDGQGLSNSVDTGTITFQVAAVNDPPHADDISVSTAEDTPITIDVGPYIGDVDTGDTPPQSLALSIVTGPATGVASVDDPTHITYTPNPPANFNGVVSLVYRVDDQQGASNSTDNGTITISVDPVDDAPVAADQSVSTNEDTNLNVNLGPTTDVDDESVTYSVPPALQPAHGVVTVVGTVATYDPDLDYAGPDSFQFQATDGNSVTTGTIDVTVNPVNDAPVADHQDLSTDEDTALPITLTASDVDNTQAELTFEVIGEPSNGTLDTTTGSNLVYTPDADYNGPDSITFRVTDPDGAESTESVTITVVPVNDAPVANDLHVDTDEDTPVGTLLTASGIDTAQGDLVFTVTVPPQFGTLSGANDNLVYTPNLNYSGPDSFQFEVSDGALQDAGEVTITVVATNDPPTAIPQVVATDEDTALPIHLDATDPDDATSALDFEVIAGPSHGSLDTASGQDLVYTPDLDHNGYDAFVFEVTDPSGAKDQATVVISVGDVGTNDFPVAEDQTLDVDEDVDAGTVVSATDADGDDLTYAIEVQPAHGTAAILNDVVIYSPSLNYSGTDLIVFKVDDGHGGFSFGSIDVVVHEVNDNPDAIPQTVTLLEDTPADIVLTGTDVDGDSLAFEIVTPPAHGTLSGSAPNVTYTPDTDYYGSDAFEFSVSDGRGGSSTAVVSLMVDPAPKIGTSLFAEGVVATVTAQLPIVSISIPMEARLTDAAGNPMPGQAVTFFAGNSAAPDGEICTAVTNSDGYAQCTGLIHSIRALVSIGYTAYYAGDEDHLASSDTGPLLRLLGLKIL
jgi:hypothetical protein